MILVKYLLNNASWEALRFGLTTNSELPDNFKESIYSFTSLLATLKPSRKDSWVPAEL